MYFYFVLFSFYIILKIISLVVHFNNWGLINGKISRKGIILQCQYKEEVKAIHNTINVINDIHHCTAYI